MPIIILTVAVYIPAMRGGFILDDYNEVVENPNIKNHLLISIEDKPFRAIPAALYRLCYAIAGDSPIFFHATNLFFHLIAGLLLGLLIGRLLSRCGVVDRKWGGVAAIYSMAIFLLHPLSVEAVSYVSGLSDVTAAVFVFGGLYLTLLGCENEKINFAHSSIGLLFLIAALFCKENAIVGLVLASGIHFMFAKVNVSFKNIARYAKYIPYILLFIGWSYFRLHHKIDLGSSDPDPYYSRAWWTPFWSLGEYTRLAFWPFGTCIEHGAGPKNPYLSPAVWLGIAMSAIIVYSLIVFIITKNRIYKLTAFAALWWFACLSIVIILPLANPVGDRRAYMALGSFSMSIAMLLHANKNAAIIKRLDIVSIAAIIVLYAGMSARYTHKWETTEKLWGYATQMNVSSARVWNGYGQTLIDAGKIRSAKFACSRAVALEPTLAEALLNLGVISEKEGDPEGAENYFKKLLGINPGYWMSYVDLAGLEEDRGDYKKAEEYIRLALAINPGHHVPWFNLGNVLRLMGRFSDARKAYTEALKVNPGHVGSKVNLALTYEDIGDLTTAKSDLEKILGDDPNVEDALFSISRIEYNLGSTAASISYLERYLKLKQDDGRAWQIMGKMLMSVGKKEEAEAAMRRAESIGSE